MAAFQLNDGRWVVQRNVKTINGKKKTTREYFGRGKEAEFKAKARDQEIKANKVATTIVDTGLTFNELALKYQNTKMVPQGMSETDQTATYYKLRKYILPFFGNKKALAISQSLCQEYVEKRSKDKVKGKKTAVKSITIRREIQIVKAILNWGCDEKQRLIPHNPIAAFKLPHKKDAEEIPLPSDEEIDRIFDAAAPHLKRFILLNVNTGMRSGAEELLKTRWAAVNFNLKVISVISAEKGGAGLRRVPLNDAFVATLKAWKVEDARDQGIQESAVTGPIVHYKGKPVARIKTAWKGALNRAGIKRRIRPYDLRHFFATMMVEVAGMGVKSLSELLGNSPDTAQRYYLHGVTEEKRVGVDSLKKVTKFLKRKRRATP